MHHLPPALIEAIQAEARRAVLHYAPSRSELAALRQVVMARLCVLTPAERAFLAALLPALSHLRPGVWVKVAEVLALAAVAPGHNGDALRTACAPYLMRKGQDAAGAARALGKLMARVTAAPVGGLYLERIEPEHRRDSAVYRVVDAAGWTP